MKQSGFRATYLSKSNLMLGMTCPKAIHLSINQPSLKTKPGPAQQAIFDQGNEVGAKAREYFDSQGAIINAKPWEYPQSLKSTKQAMDSDAQTIFEAAISDGTLYSRIDILHRKNGEWHVIEVKASNSVKEEHVTDVAIQALTLKRAGINVASYSVMHLNKQAIYPDLSELFVIQEITGEVYEVLSEVEQRVDELIKVTQGQEPKRNLGKHCDDPYECPFKAHCWKDIPNYNVFELPRMDADKAGELVAQGLVEITQLKPEMFPESEKIQRAIRATVSGERFVDKAGITKAVSEWKYPLHFLDFETVMPAIPRYDGCWPYTQVTYQFSCHIIDKAGGELRHREYLHLEASDPREKLVAELVDAVGPTGSVVSYYAKFEAARMKELAKFYPQHAAKLMSIVERLVDPLPLMQEFVYDRDFHGSFSIKKVAPALLGGEYRYDNKDVSDGLMAGVLADKCLRGLVPLDEVQGIKPKLLSYCQQDTMAMVQLWEWTKEIR